MGAAGGGANGPPPAAEGSGKTASETHQVTVHVTNGVVTLSGTLRLHSTADSVCHVAYHVPGVITVHNDLRYDIDDFLITGL